jgi:hypothetical protein
VADANLVALNRALGDGIRECQTQLDYTPSYFIRMLSEMGPVEAVRHLVTSPTPSEGFTRLWQLRRLELTVEFVALRPEFACYFADISGAAQRRLDEYGFATDAGPSTARTKQRATYRDGLRGEP